MCTTRPCYALHTLLQTSKARNASAQVWSSRGAAPAAASSARERERAGGVCAGDEGAAGVCAADDVAAGVCAGEDVWSDDWRRDFCADLPNLSDARYKA